MMKLPSLRSVSVVAAIIGLIVPRVFLAYHVEHFAPSLVRALWPTAPGVISMGGYHESVSAYTLVLAAVAANVLVYVLAFGFLWFVVRTLTEPKRSLRDGRRT